MKHGVELQPFRVPNYVLVKSPTVKRQDGFIEVPKFHLSELSNETLNELCNKFREDVFLIAAKGMEP